jgi:glycosyltransferase 2 family protein
VGYLSFITPSGLGVREGVLTALLALVYPLPVAIVASLLFRLMCTLGEFAAILLFFTFSGLVCAKGTYK